MVHLLKSTKEGFMIIQVSIVLFVCMELCTETMYFIASVFQYVL